MVDLYVPFGLDFHCGNKTMVLARTACYSLGCAETAGIPDVGNQDVGDGQAETRTLCCTDSIEDCIFRQNDNVEM